MNKSFKLCALTCAISAASVILTGCDETNTSAEATATATPTPVVASTVTPTAEPTIQLKQIGRYANDVNEFDESAAEIITFDAASKRAFVVNAQAVKVDVLDLTDPTMPQLSDSIDAKVQWPDAGGINSVDVKNGLLVVAVEHDTKQVNGRVQVYNAADLSFISQVEVGALPDNVVFSHDGKTVLVANEGEPNSTYSVDPEGSVSIIDLTDATLPSVRTASFEAFNIGNSRADELSNKVRIFGNFAPTSLTVSATNTNEAGNAELTLSSVEGIAMGDWVTLSSSEGDPIAYRVLSINAETNTVEFDDEFNEDSEIADAGAEGLMVYLMDGQSSVAQDLEPEYITVSADDSTAFVAMQENNAIAVIDIASAKVTKIMALGYKDHSVAGNELDASDKDDAVNIKNWPLMGMYMPDTIASFDMDGSTYIVTANEGDSREYDAFVEDVDFKNVGIDSDTFATASDLEENEQLGSLATSIAQLKMGADADMDGKFDTLYSYGARSFTIWHEDGSVVFDSGADFANITAEEHGLNFNNTNSKNDGDSRSDNKGAEPEALTLADIGDKRYAFIGLERTGGIMVYDITTPSESKFVQYINNRDFDYPIKANIDKGSEPAHIAGDLAPEGMKFIPAADSPNGKALLLVANEVSGTSTVYEIVSE